MGFSRQEYWSGLPCPPPGDLPNPRIEPRSLASQVDSLLLIVCFDVQKLLRLIRSHLFIFVFISNILGGGAQKLQIRAKRVDDLFEFFLVTVTGLVAPARPLLPLA